MNGTTIVGDYFGGCPWCGRNDGYIDAGRSHWFICHAHRVRWFVGINLFSSAKLEAGEIAEKEGITFGEALERMVKAAEAQIGDYRTVRPLEEGARAPAAVPEDHVVEPER